jgi:hypothetical protein
MKIRLPQWTILIAAALLTIGCSTPVGHNLPPAERLMEPGPGVGGPGPGVIPPMQMPPQMMQMHPQMMQMAMPTPTVQFLFQAPTSMQVHWDVSGIGQFDSTPLIVPGRASFPQGNLFRLKVANIPVTGREGWELYPTLEVASVTPRTAAFLEHNAVPIQLSPDDFEQVAAGNFVTKAIYLPNPEYQLPSVAGVETIVSTRLDQGIDPIVEADRRGSILAVIRIGNKDLEAHNAAGFAQMMPPQFNGAMVGGGMMYPQGGMHPQGGPPPFVAGVTSPQYGMTTSGTPIGLPGPPHIPLGGQAGLRRHTVTNHTQMHVPSPNSSFDVHVRQRPGYSYPVPPNRAYIREQSFQPTLPYGPQQPYRARTVDGSYSPNGGQR